MRKDAVAPMAQADVQTAARKALPTNSSDQLLVDASVPQAHLPDSRLSQDFGLSQALYQVRDVDEKSSAASTAQGALQKEPDSMAAKASKAAATALPDSDSEDDFRSSTKTEQTTEDSAVKSTGDLARAGKQRILASPRSTAEAAGKAAATALSDSDEEADEDLESQASVSVPGLPSPTLDRAPRSHSDQAGSSALLPQAAAESAAPGRRLGRLDSLSASDTESAEVQSQQGSAARSVQQDRPAASPWTDSFGAATISALGTEAASTPGGGAASAFGRSMLASGASAASAPGGTATAFGVSHAAPIRSARDSGTPALNQSTMRFVKGTPASSTGTPSLGLRSGVSNAAPTQSTEAPALPIARQGPGSLPTSDAASSFGQPGALHQRQPSTALPSFRPLVSVRPQMSWTQCMPEDPFSTSSHQHLSAILGGEQLARRAGLC